MAAGEEFSLDTRPPGAKPNIMWIMLDDLSKKLPWDGDYTLGTPENTRLTALKRIADDGTIYPHCWAAAPTCAPQQGNLWNSVDNFEVGTQNQFAIQSGMQAVAPKGMEGFPELLRRAGYYTSAMGKFDYQTGEEMPIYWDFFKGLFSAETDVPKFMSSVYGPTRDSKSVHFGKPFFSVFNINDPHEISVLGHNVPLSISPGTRIAAGETVSVLKSTSRYVAARLMSAADFTPFTPTADFVVPPGDYSYSTAFLTSLSDIQHNSKDTKGGTMNNYAPYFESNDAAKTVTGREYDNMLAVEYRVRNIMDRLDSDGIYNNTYMFFFADHGSGVTRAKRTLSLRGLGVPLLVKGPTVPRGKIENENTVSLIDLATTVLSLAGIQSPKIMTGKPFLGASKVIPARNASFSFLSRMGLQANNQHSVQNTRWFLRYMEGSNNYADTLMSEFWNPQMPFGVIQSHFFIGDTGTRQLIAHKAAGTTVMGPVGQYVFTVDGVTMDLGSYAPHILMAHNEPRWQLFDIPADPWFLNNLLYKPITSTMKSATLYQSDATNTITWAPIQHDETLAAVQSRVIAITGLDLVTELRANRMQGRYDSVGEMEMSNIMSPNGAMQEAEDAVVTLVGELNGARVTVGDSETGAKGRFTNYAQVSMKSPTPASKLIYVTYSSGELEEISSLPDRTAYVPYEPTLAAARWAWIDTVIYNDPSDSMAGWRPKTDVEMAATPTRNLALYGDKEPFNNVQGSHLAMADRRMIGPQVPLVFGHVSWGQYDGVTVLIQEDYKYVEIQATDTHFPNIHAFDARDRLVNRPVNGVCTNWVYTDSTGATVTNFDLSDPTRTGPFRAGDFDASGNYAPMPAANYGNVDLNRGMNTNGVCVMPLWSNGEWQVENFPYLHNSNLKCAAMPTALHCSMATDQSRHSQSPHKYPGGTGLTHEPPSYVIGNMAHTGYGAAGPFRGYEASSGINYAGLQVFGIVYYGIDPTLTEYNTATGAFKLDMLQQSIIPYPIKDMVLFVYEPIAWNTLTWTNYDPLKGVTLFHDSTMIVRSFRYGYELSEPKYYNFEMNNQMFRLIMRELGSDNRWNSNFYPVNMALNKLTTPSTATFDTWFDLTFTLPYTRTGDTMVFNTNMPISNVQFQNGVTLFDGTQRNYYGSWSGSRAGWSNSGNPGSPTDPLPTIGQPMAATHSLARTVAANGFSASTVPVTGQMHLDANSEYVITTGYNNEIQYGTTNRISELTIGSTRFLVFGQSH